jgi:anti-sigma regulatory factor (Ser/Thr protein kinase)
MDQSFDAGTLYALRSALAAHASDLGLTGPQLERLAIVAGELATNAVRHGGGTGRLRLWRDRSLLHCEISDRGPGIPDTAVGATPPDPMTRSGRGMWICRQLSDALLIETEPNGSTVTAVIRLDDDDDHNGHGLDTDGAAAGR